MGGLASATFFWTVKTGAAGAVALAYLASVPVLAVGLSQGLTLALISATIATLAIFAGIGARAVIIYLAISAIPAIIVVRQALFSRPGNAPGQLEWYPIGMILGWLTGFGLLLLTIASIYALAEDGGLRGLATQMLTTSFARGIEVTPNMEKVFAIMALYLPGTMLATWLLISIANTLLAQNVLSRMGHAIRPLPTYSSFDLPNWMSIALASAVLLTFFSGQIADFGRNSALLLSTPFFLLGLAVIHTLSRNVSARAPLLVGFYLAFVLFMSLLGPLVVLLGVFEQWISLRHRFAKPGEDQENE
tara:strand:- start:18346 stop:19257 length:912 start_codon:yes stop_codon:yes gene_type:complete